MPRLVPSDVHVSTYLTNVGLMYMNDPANYIAHRIAPVVNVNNESDKYPIWTQADFYRVEAKQIAMGDPAPRGGYAASSDTYTCDEYAIATVLPERLVANQDSIFSLETNGTRWVTDQLLLKREYDAAATIFSATNYTNTAAIGTQWNLSNATPIEDMLAGIDLVEDQTGGLPANKIVMGIEVWRQVAIHPQTIAYMFGVGGDRMSVVTPNLLSQFLSGYTGRPVEILVGRGVYNSSAENATASYSKIWGKHCWIAHVPSAPSPTTPSAAYTFQAKYEVRKWYETHTKNTIIEARELRDIKAVAAACAYYYTACVA